MGDANVLKKKSPYRTWHVWWNSKWIRVLLVLGRDNLQSVRSIMIPSTHSFKLGAKQVDWAITMITWALQTINRLITLHSVQIAWFCRCLLICNGLVSKSHTYMYLYTTQFIAYVYFSIQYLSVAKIFSLNLTVYIPS